MLARRLCRTVSSLFINSRSSALESIKAQNFAGAIPHLQAAMGEAEKFQDQAALAEVVDYLSYANFALSDYQALAEALLKKLELLLQFKASEVALLNSLQNLVRCHFDSNDFEKALFFLSTYKKLLKKPHLSKTFEARMRLMELMILVVLEEAEPEMAEEVTRLLKVSEAEDFQAMCYQLLGLLELIREPGTADLAAMRSHFAKALYALESMTDENKAVLMRQLVADKVNLDQSVEAKFEENMALVSELVEADKLAPAKKIYLNNKRSTVVVANLVDVLLSQKKPETATRLVLVGLESASRLGSIDHVHRLWISANAIVRPDRNPEEFEKNLENASRFALVNGAVTRNAILMNYASYLDGKGQLYEASTIMELTGPDHSHWLMKDLVLMPEMKFQQTKL